MVQYLNETLTTLKNLSVPTSIEAFFDMLNTPLAIVLAGLLVVFAFEGYKMFKALLYIIGALGFGVAGDVFLAPLVPESIINLVPDNITFDVHATVAVICALAGVLITRLSMKFIVFLCGGGAGYLVGHFFITDIIRGFFPTLSFLEHDYVNIAVGIACAIVASIAVIVLFKYIYIIASSIGGMASAALIVGKTMMPDEGKFVMLCFIGVGVVVGIFAASHQFVEEQKSYEIDF